MVGRDPSQILGTMWSNGHVFLTNPNGILFGAGAQIDVAGLVASTLNLSNADFLAGRMRFTDTPGAGSIENQGNITTSSGGQVYLIAPDVKNSGIITSPQGEVVLAAGRSVEIFDSGTPNLHVEITAPDTQALNIGKIIADSGRIGVYAGLIRNSGEMRADSVAIGQNGEILLKATGNVILDSDSVLSAGGVQGGKVDVQAQGVLQSGAVSADGASGSGGSVSISATTALIQTQSAITSASGATDGGSVQVATGADGNLFTSGTLLATGGTGNGGQVKVLGGSLSLVAANLDASGDTRGGTILVGGGAQGSGDTLHAKNVFVNFSSTLKADARKTGNGGNIVLWSDNTTQFFGSLFARGGINSGNGGLLEVSGKDRVAFGGYADAHARSGLAGDVNGSLLLDPHNIVIDSSASSASLSQRDLVDPNPDSGSFGDNVRILSSGNTIVTDSYDTFGGASAGAAYLFNGSNGALISALTGSHVGDRVGYDLRILPNSNYLVVSPFWNGSAGAVTFGSAVTGTGSGTVSGANSLVGANPGDNIGSNGIQIFGNSSYLVFSPNFNSGAGSITYGNGATGVKGTVSAANSLVGSAPGENVGADGGEGGPFVSLPNGNFLFRTPNWSNSGTLNSAGAVTWMNGANGKLSDGTSGGVVGPANSLVGSADFDNVGSQVTPLSYGSGYGHALILSSNWNSGTGAATWMNGNTGKLSDGSTGGTISTANSLLGSAAGDCTGCYGFTELYAGNALIRTPYWSNAGALSSAGAVTWINTANGKLSDGSTGGIVGTANSLVGSFDGDQVAYYGISALYSGASYGNAIVLSPTWNGNTGAITWINGSNGKLSDGSTGGVIGTANSVLGSAPGEFVYQTNTLDNGNVLVLNQNWTGGGMFTNAGSITWMNTSNGKLSDGSTGGVISASNSLVGNADNDYIGSGGIGNLSNGNALIFTPHWSNNGTAADTGAVTWINGSNGKLSNGMTGGIVDGTTGGSENSVIGSATNDLVGNGGYATLLSGNVILQAQEWSNVGTLSRAGAVTWMDTSNGQLSDGSSGGVVSAANSLVGSHVNDQVGNYGTTALNGNGYGNALVLSGNWNNNRGAVTWVNGYTGQLSNGVSGNVIGLSNSLLGSAINDQVGSTGIIPLASGNMLFHTPNWSGGKGAVTWMDASSGLLSDGSTGGAVGFGNSLIGTLTTDAVGFAVNPFYSGNGYGNAIILSPSWNGNTGAVTWIYGNTGALSNGAAGGTIGAANSLIGSAANDQVGGSGIITLANGNVLLHTPNWGAGKSAITWMDTSSGQLSDGLNGGTVGAGNSLIGSFSTDAVGSGVTPFYGGGGYGNALIASPGWNNNTGAVTWIDGYSGKLSNGNTGGTISGANSVIGSASGDAVGNYGFIGISNGNVIILTPSWSNAGTVSNAGAVTWMDTSNGLLSNSATGGVVSAANSLVGSNVNDNVGAGGSGAIFELSSGNFLVRASSWNSGAGAVTFASGTSGVSGTVSAGNSLVGAAAGDNVGWGVHELSNGNYLVLSPNWSSNSGAITFGSGASGVSGVVSPANSLVGNPGDLIGSSTSLQNLSNGNYLVYSPYWNSNTGFVTFGSGTTGVNGVISPANSLVGSAPGDYIGNYGISYLSNGNYVVKSPYWNGYTGAVTFGSGTSGVSGLVSAANSLVGSNPNDYVGGGGVQELYSTGNYVVLSPNWNGNMGAVTWADGAAGISGPVTPVNSLVGSNANDYVGNNGIQQLSNGNFLVFSPDWNSGTGAVTFGRGTTGVSGIVGAGNSLVGSLAGDRVGDGGEGAFIVNLSNGNFLIQSVFWNNSAGAMTLGDGMNGVTGVVSASNSIIGGVANSNMFYKGQDNVNNTFIVQFPNEPGGRVVVGSNVFNTVAGGGNLLFGNTPGADVTISPGSITSTLNTGTAVILQANNDITLNPGSDVITIGGGAGGNLTLQAGRSIILNSNITTDNGNLTVTANDPGAIAMNRDPGAAMLSLGSGVTLNAGTGNVNLLLSNGSTAGDITAGTGANIVGGQINVQNLGGGNILFDTGLLQANALGLGNATPAITVDAPGGNIFSNMNMSTASGGVSISANGFIELDPNSVGSTINAAGDVNISSATSSIGAFGTNHFAAFMDVTGTAITMNAGSFINLGEAGGHGLHATTGDINVTAGTSMGGTAPLSMKGPIVSDNGNVHIVVGNFLDMGDAISAPNGSITVDNGAGGAIAGDVNLNGPLNALSNIQLKAANFIDLNAGSVTSTAGSVTISSGDLLYSNGGISANAINLSSVNGMFARVSSGGAGLSATNTTTGDIDVRSSAANFIVGGGGATFNNTAASGRYFVTAALDMQINGGTANNKFAQFVAGNLLTVNGYANGSGAGVLMAANNITFNGATTVAGALGLIANGIDVNSAVQGGSVNVAAGVLNVNGGNFQSIGGDFVGTITGNVNVLGGGRIFGNPDVRLTVGGSIFINGANSTIEAFSPNSIHVSFPTRSDGGFAVNGVAGGVWDSLTSTGFFIGQTGLPAVLGQNLVVDYGVNGLSSDIVAAINAAIAATTKSGESDTTKKDKDKDVENKGQDDMSAKGNLQLQCN